MSLKPRRASARSAHPAAIAGHAIGDDRPAALTGELVAAARELRQGNVDRVRQPAAFVFLGLAQIERAPRFDELMRRVPRGCRVLRRRQTAAGQGPEEHRPRQHEDEDQHPVVLHKGHQMRGIPGAEKGKMITHRSWRPRFGRSCGAPCTCRSASPLKLVRPVGVNAHSCVATRCVHTQISDRIGHGTCRRV